MIGLATATVSVLRGTQTSAFGDEVDADTIVQTGVPIGIMPARQAATRSASDRSQEVEYSRGRVSAGTDIRMGDRLQDEGSAYIYVVTGTHQAVNQILTQDLALDLERVPTD